MRLAKRHMRGGGVLSVGERRPNEADAVDFCQDTKLSSEQDVSGKESNKMNHIYESNFVRPALPDYCFK